MLDNIKQKATYFSSFNTYINKYNYAREEFVSYTNQEVLIKLFNEINKGISSSNKNTKTQLNNELYLDRFLKDIALENTLKQDKNSSIFVDSNQKEPLKHALDNIEGANETLNKETAINNRVSIEVQSEGSSRKSGLIGQENVKKITDNGINKTKDNETDNGRSISEEQALRLSSSSSSSFYSLNLNDQEGIVKQRLGEINQFKIDIKESLENIDGLVEGWIDHENREQYTHIKKDLNSKTNPFRKDYNKENLNESDYKYLEQLKSQLMLIKKELVVDKGTKNKKVFPHDEAALKSIYLAAQNISKK